MKESLFIPVIDNGSKLAFADWGFSMFRAAISKCFEGRVVFPGRLSYGYQSGAMNHVTEQFLTCGADRMVVVDLDQDFEPKDMNHLLSHDVPLVAGCYVKKVPGMNFTLSTLPDSPNPFTDDKEEMQKNPLVEVARVSRGFINIHRSVFDLLLPTVDIIDDTQTGTVIRDWWKPYPNGHSEDFAFCDRYRAAGGKVYVDQRIRIGHWGPIKFPIPGTF